jgi:hypothetical protein
MTSRRQAFALAGALTVTLFTAVVALAGFSHRPAPRPSAPAVVQVAPTAAPAAPGASWMDD